MNKLILIQQELKAPKNQKNKFGGYNYRSCEDILEALKPLLAKYNCTLLLTDDVQQVGDRFYVKATATFYELTENTCREIAHTTAFARESIVKKGSDEAQITGAASSYARKYALNGLFLIDDSKDADTADNSDDEILTTYKKRIKQLIDSLDPAIDTTQFAGWEQCTDKAKLVEIGKKLQSLGAK